MPEHDKKAIPPARTKVAEALAAIAEAENELEAGNWPEMARWLHRSYDHLAVWTAPGGIFDHMEKPPS